MDEKSGKDRISDEIIAVCAMNAALKTDGIAEMAAGITDNLSKSLLGKESLSKGIKITGEKGKEGIEIDVYVNVQYGKKIPETAWEVQENVKKSVEELTETTVKQVNIHVQGVNFDAED